MRVSLPLFVLLLTLALTPCARAEDEPPPAGEKPAAEEVAPLRRGLIDCVYIDEYFGLSYGCEGLKKGFGFGGPTTLFSGTCGDGVEVELLINEAREVMTPEAILTATKAAWAKDGQRRSEMEEGMEPHPWALFVQESLAGFKRHHGYAFYPRGNQIFVVHAQIREKSETSSDTLKSAIQRLELGAPTDSYLVAHLVAAQIQKDPRSAIVRLQAGVTYVTREDLKNLEVGRKLLEGALAEMKDSDIPADGMWQAVSALGLAQLMTGGREVAIATWKRAIEIATKTSQAANLGANSWYNLACAYSLLNRLDEAFEALGKGLSMGDAEQQSQLREHAKSDTDLEALRKDARWASVAGPKGG